MSADILVGIDTGGTFTDFVVVRDAGIDVLKLASTPDDPSRAILQGIAALGLQPELISGRLRIVHGSTVATNAVLEGRLARTLYVTNRGFEDVPELARQARADLYELHPRSEPTLVPRDLRYGTGGRLTSDGAVLEPLTSTDLDALVQFAEASGAQAAAVNLLYSFVDADHEKMIEQRLAPTLFVSRSSFVLPEYREYERGIATYLNAALGPGIAHYLDALQRAAGSSRLAIMMSSGGTIAAPQAAKRAVSLLLSGPAGGLIAASRLGASMNQPRLLTFDMGGTSTDVALVNSAHDHARDGGLRLTQEGRIGPWPIAITMADIHTIGAGGGSIARVDEGGLLQVGPQSAGAVPGPACYGRGGTLPTVTDANLALGRLRPDAFLGGAMHLDTAAARTAIAPLAQQLAMSVTATALGIIRVANEHMALALRVISVERGEDPRGYGLCCYGGAGGLHVCALADALEIRTVLLPPSGAVFSALGMIQARPARHVSRSLGLPLAGAAATLAIVLEELTASAMAELVADGWPNSSIELSNSVDLRYRGQSYWLNLHYPADGDMHTLGERFHRQHAQRYGHRIDTGIELVNARVAANGPLPKDLWQQATAPQPWSAPARAAALRPAGIDRDSYAGAGEQAGTVIDVSAADVGPDNEPDAIRTITRSELQPGEIVSGIALITEAYTTTLVEAGWLAAVTEYGCLQLQRVT